jgi:multidrug resistance efflux pump
MKKLLPSLIALAVALTGVGVLLYTWQLPPFASGVAITENAYVRGKVTSISPVLSGHVAEVLVQDFDTVTEGQPLFRLDDRSYRQKVAQAGSQLEGAKASLANADQSTNVAEATVRLRASALQAAEAALTTAQSAFDRNAALAGQGVVSTSSSEQAQLSLDQAQAAVSQANSQLDVAREDVKSVEVSRLSLEAAVSAAEAALQLAQIDLDNTLVSAPAAGRLGEVGARVGQYVSAGSSLVSLVPQNVWVIANFKETQLYGMQPGQAVNFTVDALKGQRFNGHLERFSPAMGSEFSLLGSASASGNFTKIAQRLPVRISVDSGQEMAEWLRPGMSVVVSIAKSGYLPGAVPDTSGAVAAEAVPPAKTPAQP